MLPATSRPTSAQIAAAAAVRQQRDADLGMLFARQQQRDSDGYGSYGMRFARCGGTPSGDSVRGFVGRCNCRSAA